MRYEPHEYQKYAVDYIETHPAAAIFLDCGLGKTSITLTSIADLLFDSFEVHKVLVIAPLRVARDTWTAEADKWDHLQDLICSVAVGTEAQRRSALMRRADIYIINRENVQWLIDESGIPFDFDMVVIDELSSFKNHQTKRFKSLLKVRPKVSRIVGLTGTPASNGLMDLWRSFASWTWAAAWTVHHQVPHRLLHAGQAKRPGHLLLQTPALCRGRHLPTDFGHHHLYEVRRPPAYAKAGQQ